MKTKYRHLSVYHRIVANAEKGTGTYLTVDETWQLAHDEAVLGVIRSDEEAQQRDLT